MKIISTLPGSKSLAQRAIICAALCQKPTTLHNVPTGDDVTALLNAISACGVTVQYLSHTSVKISPPKKFKTPKEKINVGHGGTPLRFLVAFLGHIPGQKILDGSARLKERPIWSFVQSLNASGAQINSNTKKLPLTINQSKHTSSITLDGSKSSQFISATLLSGLSLGISDITVTGKKTSASYITITQKILADFGITATPQGFLLSGTYTSPTQYTIEPDWASAGYILGASLLSGWSVAIPDLSPDSIQPDAGVLSVLKKMGIHIETKNGALVCIPKKITSPGKINCELFPDSAQTIAILAAFCANQTTTLTGLHTLPFKECDRITATITELNKMGIQTTHTKDSITIFGGTPKATQVDTYHDHRMAMAFAMAQIKQPQIHINTPNVVSKSFPNFWSTMQQFVQAPHLFVAVFGKTKQELITLIQKTAQSTNTFELRTDLCGAFILDPKIQIKDLFPTNTTVLLTHRPSTQQESHAQIKQLADQCQLINLDLEDANKNTQINPQKTVLAHHRFNAFSKKEITQTIDQLQQFPAAYYKMAIYLETHQDLLDFMHLIKELPKHKWILMGMGPMGKISRIICASMGFATFACIPGKSVAPGQIEIDTLQKILNNTSESPL
jgi:3-phosphoshikimate 1-carboxyvinyltransferase